VRYSLENLKGLITRVRISARICLTRLAVGDVSEDGIGKGRTWLFCRDWIDCCCRSDCDCCFSCCCRSDCDCDDCCCCRSDFCKDGARCGDGITGTGCVGGRKTCWRTEACRGGGGACGSWSGACGGWSGATGG